jgi:hypothetical protein
MTDWPSRLSRSIGLVESEVAVAGWTLVGAWASPVDANITTDAQDMIPRLTDRIDLMAATSAAVEGCIPYASGRRRCEQSARAQPANCLHDSENLGIAVIWSAPLWEEFSHWRVGLTELRHGIISAGFNQQFSREAAA